MRFRRMWAKVALLLSVGLVAVLCSCAPMSKVNEPAPKASEPAPKVKGRLYCLLVFAVDPAEFPTWEAPVRAVYRQVRGICHEHGAAVSSSYMTNYHDSEGHSVYVRVWVATEEGARLADALLKHIRCAEEVFLESMATSWWHDDSWESDGTIHARFVRGSKEPSQVERSVQEIIPLDD